jgi:hypothetical protein
LPPPPPLPKIFPPTAPAPKILLAPAAGAPKIFALGSTKAPLLAVFVAGFRRKNDVGVGPKRDGAAAAGLFSAAAAAKGDAAPANAANALGVDV